MQWLFFVHHNKRSVMIIHSTQWFHHHHHSSLSMSLPDRIWKKKKTNLLNSKKRFSDDRYIATRNLYVMTFFLFVLTYDVVCISWCMYVMNFLFYDVSFAYLWEREYVCISEEDRSFFVEWCGIFNKKSSHTIIHYEILHQRKTRTSRNVQCRIFSFKK